jgi:hypothetical protein
MRRFVLVALAACGSSHGPTADAPLGSLETPPNTWAWVGIDGTTCANGSTAGIGINRSGQDDGTLFVYFEGGGACWDTATCTAQPPVAVNLDVTYDQDRLNIDVAGLQIQRQSGTILDTTNFVFVPYCTADLHAGTTVTAYPGGPTIHHTGGTNTQTFVDKLHDQFPDAQTIWLVGSSAGGYGATLDMNRFSDAWPSAQVELLEDSSPFIPFVANYATLQTAWAIAFPPGCADCTTNFTSAFDTVVAAHPTSRIGLLTWDNDQTIEAYFGYTTALAPIQADLLANHFNKPHTRVYEAPGTSHTMLGELTSISVDNVLLEVWVAQWLAGDPQWEDVGFSP